jgi:hypothetical protein
MGTRRPPPRRSQAALRDAVLELAAPQYGRAGHALAAEVTRGGALLRIVHGHDINPLRDAGLGGLLQRVAGPPEMPLAILRGDLPADIALWHLARLVAAVPTHAHTLDTASPGPVRHDRRLFVGSPILEQDRCGWPGEVVIDWRQHDDDVLRLLHRAGADRALGRAYWLLGELQTQGAWVRTPTYRSAPS